MAKQMLGCTAGGGTMRQTVQEVRSPNRFCRLRSRFLLLGNTLFVEHDIQDIAEKILGENHYIFSGRIAISFLNEKYFLKIEENDHYETLAGYLLFHHSSFPKYNTILHIGSFEFKILKSTRTKIEMIEMKKISNF